MSADTLVPVGRFLDPAEAQMARGMLEAAGIECFLGNEHANAVMPLTIRVRLSVLRRDAEEAQMLLLEAEGDPDA